jgi:CRISPR-associated protein Csb2
MFALGLQYLTGVVYATDPSSREQPEWPPHPDRVFMAMVAAHHETDADPAEREALLWLERLGPPSIAASATGQPRRAVTTFVPVNDTEGPHLKARKSPSPAQLASGVSLLPEKRSRQPRTFPSVVPYDPTVFFIWSTDVPQRRLADAIDGLCRKVIRVGHSASLVQMWVEASPPAPTLEPTAGVPRARMRVPGRGRLTALEARFPRLRPSTGQWASYGDPSPQHLELTRGGAFAPDLLVFRRVGGRPLGLESTPLIVDTARRAILSLAAHPLPEWVSGHSSDGSPSRQPHVAIVPLADVGHEHADGHLLGLAVALPVAVSSDAVAQAFGVLLGTGSTGELRPLPVFAGKLLDWTLEYDLRSDRPRALEPETWTAIPDGARRWATVTPIVLDRYPKRDGDVEETTARACEHAGLPRPADVVIAPVSVFAGAPTTWSMPPMAGPGGKGARLHTHAIFSFDEPVIGPVLVGAGRYRGYGLCRPLSRAGA